jgi:hypothetical protein
VIGYFFLIIYNLVRFIKHNFLFSTGPLFEKNGLIVFQKSPYFVPPDQRSKKYVFIDFLFNLVTICLCFLKFTQFVLLLHFVNWEYSICFLYTAILSSWFIHGNVFFLWYLDLIGACLFNTLIKKFPIHYKQNLFHDMFDWS